MLRDQARPNSRSLSAALSRALLAAVFWFLPGSAVLSGEPGSEPTLLEGNMIGNPSFEYDWMNNQAEGHVLAFRGDWSFNSSDLKPDHWDAVPPANAKWVSDTAHTGARSLLLSGASSISRTLPLGVWSAGGGGWSGPTQKPMVFEPAARLARTLRGSVWYKAAGLDERNRLVVQVSFGGVAKEVAVTAAPQDWARLEVVLPKEEIEKAYAEGKVKGVPANEGLLIRVEGAAQVWIDDVSLAEDLAADPNLAINGSFENIDNKANYPRGWSGPKKYTWRPPMYYRWTDWYHWFRPIRGPIQTTDLFAHAGRRSLLMQVYPGDEVMIEGEPVVLAQGAERGIVEVGAYVMLDRVKWIDIRAADQDGRDVPCVAAYSGGWRTPPDSNQVFPSNAHQWMYVRKWFQGAAPLKTIRPQLCARGFNGDTRDDAGTRPNVCQVGLAWWDDVRVIERSATPDELARRNLKFAPPVKEAPDSVMVASLDPGERLFGDNVASVTLTNPTKKTISASVNLSLAAPGHVPGQAPEKPVEVEVKAGGSKNVPLPYTIERLAGSWDRQAAMELAVTVKKDRRSVTLAYNTWPVLVDVDFSKHYATPAENPQSVAFNFGIAAGTLQRTKSVEVEIRRRRDDSTVDTVKVPDLAAAMAQTLANLPKSEQEGMEFGAAGPVYWADKRNLLVLKMDLSKVPVRAPDDPCRDHYLYIKGLDAKGEITFDCNSQYFGRVEQINETLPKITETSVRQDGAVLINGQPVFIMADGGYPSARNKLSDAMKKQYGMNAVRWVHGDKEAAKHWREGHLYSLETIIGLGVKEADLQQSLASGELDGAITLSCTYESSLAMAGPEEIAKHKEFARLSREVAHRVSNFGAGGAHNIYTMEPGFGIYESFGMELEPFGPPRGEYELAPALRKGGVAWFHLPQTYDPEPFEQFRHDQYIMIIGGGRGFSIIQGLGDPSLYRGITGEIRKLSPAIFSLDKGDPRTTLAPNIHWMQRRVGNTTTIIAASVPPIQIGDWTWRDTDAFSGKRAHTGVSAFKWNEMPDGLRLHGMRQLTPRLVQKGDRLVQYVWLDPKSPPTSIAWGARGDAKWDFNGHWGKPFDFAKWRTEWVHYWAAGELLPGTWQIAFQFFTPKQYEEMKKTNPAEADKQLKAVEPIRDWWAEHILSQKSFLPKGDLPPKGKWTRLELSADELGLVGKQLDGFLFLAKDGEAWWDHTALLRDGNETVLCEDSLSFPEEELRAVRVSVPWAPDGTKVKVLFEERELEVKNGEFVDDFRGTDIFGAIRDAAVGDAEGWYPPGITPIAQTLGYTTPCGPTEVHIYELSPGAK